MRVIDAGRSPEEVLAEALEAVTELLGDPPGRPSSGAAAGGLALGRMRNFLAAAVTTVHGTSSGGLPAAAVVLIVLAGLLLLGVRGVGLRAGAGVGAEVVAGAASRDRRGGLQGLGHLARIRGLGEARALAAKIALERPGERARGPKIEGVSSVRSEREDNRPDKSSFP